MIDIKHENGSLSRLEILKDTFNLEKNLIKKNKFFKQVCIYAFNKYELDKFYS